MKTSLNHPSTPEKEKQERTRLLQEGKVLLNALEGEYDLETLSHAEQLEITSIRNRLKELIDAIEKEHPELPKHYQETLAKVKEKVNQQSIEEIRKKYENDPEKLKAIDAFQAALDLVGLEQTRGAAADGVNAIIYLFRSAQSAFKGKGKEASRHLLDAGISAVSIIPFADLIKLLRLRKAPKLAKATIKGARQSRKYANKQKIKRIQKLNDKKAA